MLSHWDATVACPVLPRCWWALGPVALVRVLPEHMDNGHSEAGKWDLDLWKGKLWGQGDL